MARLLIALLCLLTASQGFAHGGGLNADGCHTNRKTGDYHCHRAPAARTAHLRLLRTSSGPVLGAPAAPSRTAPKPGQRERHPCAGVSLGTGRTWIGMVMELDVSDRIARAFAEVVDWTWLS